MRESDDEFWSHPSIVSVSIRRLLRSSDVVRVIKVYVVQDNEDYRNFRSAYPQTLQKNERLVYNDDPSASRKLMGARIASAHFTPNVLMAGMSADLLYTIISSMVSSNKNPNKAVRLIS